MFVICSSCDIRISKYPGKNGDPCSRCDGGVLVAQGQQWSIICDDCGHVLTRDNIGDGYRTMRCGCRCHDPLAKRPEPRTEAPAQAPTPTMPPKLKPSKAAKYEAKGPRPTRRGR